jgi:hypothetical protein
MPDTATLTGTPAMTADDHLAAAVRYLAAAERTRGNTSPEAVTAVAAIATAHATIAAAMRSGR